MVGTMAGGVDELLVHSLEEVVIQKEDL